MTATLTAHRYGLGTSVNLPYEQAVEQVKQALQREGFGVLTEIDVKATLKKKLDVDFKRYVILGACNPSLAYQAFQTEPDVGLLLPCNVIVYEQGETRSRVAALDPVEQLSLSGRTDIRPLADEAKRRLERALSSLPL